jgi:hypothetical protein
LQQEYVDELRGEIPNTLAEHGGNWNKLAQMEEFDSLVRESLRRGSPVCHGGQVKRLATTSDNFFLLDMGSMLARGVSLQFVKQV